MWLWSPVGGGGVHVMAFPSSCGGGGRMRSVGSAPVDPGMLEINFLIVSGSSIPIDSKSWGWKWCIKER